MKNKKRPLYKEIYAMGYRQRNGRYMIKIGFGLAERRRKQHQTGCPGELVIYKTIQAADWGATESRLKQLLARDRTRDRGEWFDLTQSQLVHLLRVMTRLDIQITE